MSPFDSNLVLLRWHVRRELQGCERQIDKNRKLIARIERWIREAPAIHSTGESGGRRRSTQDRA